MSLKEITGLSHFFGADRNYVLAGGGNTSFKDERNLWIKPSGVTLAAIKESDFVKLDRKRVQEIFTFSPPADAAEREAVVKKMMSDAVCPGVTGRPSVEAPLHEIIDFKYVVHTHPALVNGMTCGKSGKSACAELFPEALWMDYTDPGYSLAKAARDAIRGHKAQKKTAPEIIFLANHGVFIGADSAEKMKSLYDSVMEKLRAHYEKHGVKTELEKGQTDKMTVLTLAPGLRSILGSETGRAAVVSSEPFKAAEGPLTPDHIVYAKSFALISGDPSRAAVESFRKEKGYNPLVISVPGKAVLCSGKTLKDARVVAELAADAGLVQQLTAAFGGANFLSGAHRSFIENWEVESYRKSVASGKGGGRLDGKIAVITGGAQGFGYGIAEELAKEGAVIAVADLNLKGAETAAESLCASFGAGKAFALEVNISDENSVAAMCEKAVLTCGGLDIFIANAGVLKAGPVKSFTKKDWDFVTDVNYTGYFLCVKHAANIMSAQNKEGGDWTDIIQVNSKSGLAGSNKNAAYAGSKFGTIGMTQSFALELLDDKIKVNSVCPGNFFDGPLWSDPVKGLFVQYLNSGKVPGAKNVDDVKKFYESKVPMSRGCLPSDVAKAIIYAVEQKYETGQAIPVTGGQIMLN